VLLFSDNNGEVVYQFPYYDYFRNELEPLLHEVGSLPYYCLLFRRFLGALCLRFNSTHCCASTPSISAMSQYLNPAFPLCAASPADPGSCRIPEHCAPSVCPHEPRHQRYTAI
jgi:hypothetical protein